MELISHYTSAKTAINCILPKESLKFNELKNTNDPWEYKKNLYVQLSENMLDVRDRFRMMDEITTYIENIKSISFTKDFPKEKERCFCNQLMWSHYGDNHKGVCLIFDRDKLVKLIKKTKNGVCLSQPNQITYSLPKEKDYPINTNKNIQEFVIENSDDLIFTKNKAWNYEKEFRLVFLPNKDKFINRSFSIKNISDALAAIILGGNCSENDKCAIEKLYKKTYSEAEFLKIIYVKPERLKIEKIFDEGCVSFCCDKILT